MLLALLGRGAILAGALASGASANPPRYTVTDITNWTPAQRATLPFFKHYAPLPVPGAPANFHLSSRTASGLYCGTIWVTAVAGQQAALVGPSGTTLIDSFGDFFWWACCPYRSVTFRESIAFDVNWAGSVVGSGNIPGSSQTSAQEPYRHPLLYTGGAGHTDLLPDTGSGWATCINNRGEIAGYAFGGPTVNSGFRRSVDGEFTQLDPVPPGYMPQPKWINAQGVIIGSSVPGAFVSPAGSTVVQLTRLFGMPLARAADLNDAGWIVGTSGSWDYTENYATLWEPGGDGTWIARDLTDLINTSGILLDSAVAINNSGQIIAAGHLDQGDGSPSGTYLLTPTTSASNSCVPDIGVHPNNSQLCGFTAPLTITVVGGATPVSYAWQIEDSEGNWSTLGNDPRPLPCGGAAWAFPINSPSVQVGLHACDGESTYRFRCVATNSCGSTISNPATVTICPADFNCDGGVDGDDVIVFFGAWDAGQFPADFNHDGGVDGDDVIDFFARWDAGC